MPKYYPHGNIAAQKYRWYRRMKGDGIIRAPWGKPLLENEDGTSIPIPEGWHYWENGWGRGYSDPHPIPTPYDYGLTDAERESLFPDWCKRKRQRKVARRRKALGKAVREIRKRVRKGPGSALKRDSKGRFLPVIESPPGREILTKKEV